MKDKLDLGDLELVDYYIAETKLIERLCISSENKINFSLFSNLLCKPIGSDEYFRYKGFYIAINILRENLGFNKDEKPGDFDILIIPHSENKIFFNRASAVEVKVVRPTRKNPKKSPNSNGVTQIQGLINDGFPIVGLIHICMTEPLLGNEKKTIEFYLAPIDEKSSYSEKDLQDNVDVKVDTFSWFSSENQMKKLITKEIPKYVGLCTIGVNVSSKRKLVTWYNNQFNPSYEAAYFNPHTKQETIEKLELFWKKNKNKFIYAER